MTQPVLEMELRPKDVAALEQPAPAVSLFERLAMDPNVPVEKLEKLIELQERIMRFNAQAAFNAAFSKMHPEIPTIDEHGRIEVRGQLRSTYAPLEDIHDVIKPILAKHGFAIRHRTEWPTDKAVIRIVGILSHEAGHSEESTFEAPADKSEYRSDIQSMGSTVSYGRRYTTLDLLNIATRKADNDGQRQQPAPEDVKAPAGFADWWTDMQACASEGWPKLAQAWNQSKAEYRNHLNATNRRAWSDLKTQAEKVKK